MHSRFPLPANRRIVAGWIGRVAALVLLQTITGAWSQTPATPATPVGRPIAHSGEGLEARADGAFCAARVKVVITATEPRLFEGEISPAAKFFTNTRAAHSLSCPRMTRMVAQGRKDGKVAFTAMADQSNGWEALILGATVIDGRAEDAALASSGPTAKSVFRSSPAFVPAPTVLAQTKDKYLCLAGATLSCEMIIKFTPQGADKVELAYRQALSGGRSAAVVTTVAALRDGFFCADPSGSTVTVEDAQMSEDAKKDYADQLRERVQSNGEICTGFSGKPEALTAYGFDSVGKGVDKPRSVKLSASLPPFVAPK